MLALALAAAALVQCPDGSPPPCRGTSTLPGRVPAAAVALSDNTWLVLPFDNTARTADAELIRQASVSQLSGEMSGWSGVRVIPDDRVADLLQSLPAPQRERPGLESAASLARRVGAGRIVLGGYLAVGGRANLTATVYDTRTQRELRVVRQALAGYAGPAALDSLAATFGRLARAILDLPPGGRSASSGIGTSSVEAYRAYVAGMDAMNRLAIDSSRALMRRAVALDSNYALAHLALWRLIPDSAQRQTHLDAALRLAAVLPPRARDLVEGSAAGLRRDRAGICRAANRLVDSDSSDAEGWAMLSTCHLDLDLVLDNGAPRLRGDLNRARLAAERAYALAPATLPSISAIVNVLQIISFTQCIPATAPSCPPDRFYRVSLLPSADSLVVAVNLWRDVKHAPPDLAPAAIAAYHDRLARLEAICERLAQATNTWIAHQVTAQLAVAAGDHRTAEAHLGRGIISSTDTLGLRAPYVRARFETALALEQDTAIAAWADSLFARRDAPQPYRSLMGHLTEGADSTPGLRQNATWRRILAGVLPDRFDTLVAAMSARITNPQQRDDMLALSTLAGFHLGYRGPALDTAARHPLKRYQARFALGDRARARAALDVFDRDLAARDEHTPDDGGWLFSAESHLELGDSAVALERMAEFARRWPNGLQDPYILEMRFFQSTTPRLWGRAWLLYGDLAAARGAPVAARRAYRMVVALWGRGDEVLQPLVARARTYLAQR